MVTASVMKELTDSFTITYMTNIYITVTPTKTCFDYLLQSVWQKPIVGRENTII